MTKKMLFKAIAFTLVYSTLSYSVTEFSNKFCDNSSMDQMIDRVFQTPTTIYIIRDNLVYPIIRKEMPLIFGTAKFWIQKSDAFPIEQLFLEIDLTLFESGFTITLDQNKKFIRDYRHNPNYYYLTFIFSGPKYYIFKELSNNSFISAKSEDIPLEIETQGSIEKVFGIEPPIHGCDYTIVQTDAYPKQLYLFTVVLLPNDYKFYLCDLHKTDEKITEIKPKSSDMKIDKKIAESKAQYIRGIVKTNLAYIVFNNSLIELYVKSTDNSEFQKLSDGGRIWEKFDCDYSADYLPRLEKLNETQTTETITTTATPESTIVVETKQTSSYWTTIIVLTLIFLFFGFIIFLPQWAFRRIENKSNQNNLSKKKRKL